MEDVPRIASVEAIGPMKLLVQFDGGGKKVYDCRQLMARPQFQSLSNPAFFRAVKVDPGGYGVLWSDDVDLSEYELWANGEPVALSEP